MYGKRTSMMVEGFAETYRFSGFRQCVSAVLALGLIFVGGGGMKIDIHTVILSLLSGTMLATSACFSLYAMKTGMVSLVSLFGTAGMIIPCLAGVFLFDKPIALMQWIGFGVFMVASYLMIMGSKATVNGFSIKTFFMLIAVMLAEGFTMLSQQMFAQYVPDGNVSVFSFLSFGIVGMVTMTAIGIFKNNGQIKMRPMSKFLVLNGIILAVAVLIINQLATLATALVSPVILFTFINGGSTVIAAIVAAVVYNEKMTTRSCVGIVLGILSFVIIKFFEV